MAKRLTLGRARAHRLRALVGTTGAAFVIGAGALTGLATAQTWDGGGVAGGDVNWTTGANWDTNVAPVNNGTALVTMAGTIDTINTVNVNYDIFALIINNTAGQFTINNSGGASLTVRAGGIINNDNQIQTINAPLIVNTGQTWAATGAPLIINGTVNLGANQLFFDSNVSILANSGIFANISGASGSIVKNGAGPMVLGGNNTFGGGLTLNNGAVAPNTDTALGTGTLTLNGGFVTNISAGTRTLQNAVTVGGNFTTAGIANLVFTGPVTLTGNRTITTDVTTTMSGAVGQDAAGRALTKLGAGSLTLSGPSANTYTGLTQVQAGALNLAKTGGVNAIGGNLTIGASPVFSAATVNLSASNQIVDTATVEILPTAAFNLGAFNELITTLRMFGGNVTGTGSLIVTDQIIHNPFFGEASAVSTPLNFGGQTVTAHVDDSGVSVVEMNLTGPISNGGLTKDGVGTLLLDGALPNTYTGTTTVNTGTLRLGKLAGVVAVPGPLTIGDGAGSDLVQLDNGAQIADTSVVTINGSGTLNLGSFVDAVGGLNMTAGTVTGGGTSFLSVSGTVTGNASATTATIGTGSIGFAGVTRTFAVADGAAAVDMDVTANVNNGGINKTGAGTLRLSGSGANTQTAQSFVSEGTLLLAKPAGVNAISQTLQIGDATGGADADVVRLENSEQIAAGVNVIITRSGLLDLNDKTETVSAMELTAGHVVNGGPDGILALAGTLTTVADTSTSLVEAEVSFGGANRVIFVGNGTVADDLVVNGSLVQGGVGGALTKQGTGTLRLTGTDDNTAALAQLAAGTIVMDKPQLDAFSGATATVGDGAGGSQVDVLRYGASDHQLPDSIEVLVNSSGLFDLNGRSDTIGTLRMNSAGFVNTGAGTLTVANSVVSDAVAAGFGTINGNLNLAGGLRPFNVADSFPAIDLTVNAAMSNGTLQKQGLGRLQLSSSAMTSPISFQLDTGTLAATGLVVGPTRTFTQNAGTFTGTITNQGTFTYNGGLFTGSLVNDGTANFNANFTATSGISNTGTFAISAGTTVTADGTGLSNEGTVSLAGGTLTANGPIINQALITGRGTIGGSAGFTNNGLVSVSGGNLTLTNIGSNTNSGNFDLAPGLQLRLQGAQLLNAGTLNLDAGTVNGFAALFNDAGGTVAGRGNITTPFTNNGTLMPDGGTLAVNIAFTNGGTILLGGAPATLTTTTVTNNGIIRGDGTVNATVNNNAAGEIRAETGKTLLFPSPTGTNNGKVNLLGGTVQFNSALTNGATGLVTGRGTLVAAGGLTNNGQVQLSAGVSDIFGTVTGNSGSKVIVSGGGTATFYNNVTASNGSEFRVSTGSTAVFFGDVLGTNNFTGSGTKIFEAGTATLDQLASVAGDTVVESPATLTANRIDEDALTVNGTANITGPATPASHVNSLSVAGTLNVGANQFGVTGAATLAGGTLAGTAGVVTAGSFNVQGGATVDATSPSGTLTLNGPMSGPGSLTKTGPGTATLTGTTSYTGGTNVDAGTLEVQRMHENNAVSIASGAKLTVLDSSPTLPNFPSGDNAFVSRPSSLAIAAGAQLDLGNNDLIVDYSGGTSPIGDIEAMIASGFNGGEWNGDGIISTTALADPNFVLAVAENALLLQPFGDGVGDDPLFAGQVVDDTTVLVKFTHRVDLDLDGLITGNDAAVFNAFFNEGQPATWQFGDLDYDGLYSGNDAAIFNGFYNESLASVPEPATAGALALLSGAGLLFPRRKAAFDR